MTADLHVVAAQLARDPECPLRAALARHLHTVAGLLGETVAADPVDVREMPAREVYARWRGVVRELLVDGDDGQLCALDAAIRDACVRHPLAPAAQHHVDAIVRECLAAVEPEARPAEVAA